MSQHHRKALIEQSFEQAERMDDQSLESLRWVRLFDQAGAAISQTASFNAAFDFQDYDAVSGFPATAAEWAILHSERVQQDPVQAMSDWIDAFPRAREAVDTYCAAQAKQDLVAVAQSHRADDLASPEQALSRRARGRAM